MSARGESRCWDGLIRRTCLRTSSSVLAPASIATLKLRSDAAAFHDRHLTTIVIILSSSTSIMRTTSQNHPGGNLEPDDGYLRRGHGSSMLVAEQQEWDAKRA